VEQREKFKTSMDGLSADVQLILVLTKMKISDKI
jgi:hypothetical protein